MLARAGLVGVGLALLGTAALASPLVLDWRVNGSGAVTGTCQTMFSSGCTSISSGIVLGTHIGSGTYALRVTTGNDGSSNSATNASGGKCLPANGPGSVTAASGAIINFNAVGWLCEEGGSGSPYHYNGTYRITGGTGRFSDIVGGGSVAATFEKGALTSNTFVKIDGTINF
jgi:hypothetical protein